MSRDRIERRVLETLADRASLHVLALAERTDEHPVSVDQACARLHDGGYIRPVGRGVYGVTDRGRRRLRETGDDRRRTRRPE